MEFEQGTKTSLEREGALVTITKQEGKYGILYGAEITGTRITPQLLGDVDGICLETRGLGLPYPRGAELEQRYGLGVNQKALLGCARALNIPIFALDCSLRPEVYFAEFLALGVELSAGAALFQKAIEKAKIRKGRMSRREFLITAGLAGAGAYLYSPMASKLSRAVSSISGVGEGETAGLSKFIQRIHPEYMVFILSLRNTVIAQKMQFLLQATDHSHLLQTFAAEHVGIEDAILTSERERIHFLAKLKPILPKAVSPETFYQAVRYKAEAGRWKVDRTFEEPNLKEMIADS
jgi:hypothetical protein